MPCVSFFLFSAGCSTEAKSKIETTTTTKILNTVLNSNKTEISNIMQNTNELTVKNTATGVFNCPQGFNIGQSIKGDFTVINNVTDQQAGDVKNALLQELKTQAQTMAKNNPDLFQSILGKAFNTKSETEVINRLETEFNNSITNEQIRSFVNLNINTNHTTIENAGLITGSSCNINQNILVTMQATNLAAGIQQALLDNQVFQKIDNEVKTTAESTSKGLPVVGCIVILVLILLLLGVGAYFFMKRQPAAGVTPGVAGVAPVTASSMQQVAPPMTVSGQVQPMPAVTPAAAAYYYY